jgi:integrase
MTNTQIQALRPGETLYDRGSRGSVKGLHLRMSATGEKSWFVYYRSKAKKERRPKLGSLPEVTLADARSRARYILERVSKGEDPRAEWEEKRAEMTVSDLYERVRKQQWSQERYRTSGWARQVENFWKNNLEKPFGKLALSEVTIVLVREWHDGYAEEAPTTGNRSLEILSRLFNFAEAYMIRPMNTNPCSYVEAHKERKRKRYASDVELQKLHTILERESTENPSAVAFIKALALTGARPRAIERAEWKQVVGFEKDGEHWGVLTYHGKTSSDSGEDEIVVFPPQLMEIINALPKTPQGTIFGHFPRKKWNAWRAEAGCPDLWARDLRRTFATVGRSKAGVDKSTVGDVLNHKSVQTTNLYARLVIDERVEAVAKTASKMESLFRAKPAKLKLVKGRATQ